MNQIRMTMCDIIGRKNEMGVCINNNGYIPKELLDIWKKDKTKTKQLIK